MGILDGHDPRAVQQAARLLAAGEVVAFATETVYGLGARADDDAAVARIFALKGRPADHPLIVHVADARAVAAFADAIPPTARRLMDACWPGPVSIVLRRRAGVAPAAAGGLATLALRCPAHPVAQALLREAAVLGVNGVATPSANRFGRVSPTRAVHVFDEFGPSLPILDGGACQSGIESAIVDLSGTVPRLLRPGSLPRAQIEAALGERLADPDAQSPRVSGSLESHYAPAATVRLLPREALDNEVRHLQAQQGTAAVAVLARHWPAGQPLPGLWQQMPDNAEAAAHDLFDVLRRFDAQGARVICIERPPADPEWDGVRDRLQRAAAPR